MKRTSLCAVTALMFLGCFFYILRNEQQGFDGKGTEGKGFHDQRDSKINFQSDKPTHEIYDNVRTLLLFIGYPRSGHTLVGSLLDAHPHVIIANEFDIIGKWQEWKKLDRNKYYLFDKLYNNSKEQSLTGYRSSTVKHRYMYAVPGQWQGRYKDNIWVVGTKKGGVTTNQLMNKGSMALLREIHASINIPVKFVHVIRNPYDNIATMMLRRLGLRDYASQEEKINEPEDLDHQITKYFALAKKNSYLEERFGADVLQVHSSDVIKKPKETLGQMCEFLQLTCDQQYLTDCSKIIYSKASKTRHTVVWTQTQKKLVKKMMAKFPCFKNYGFDD